MDFRNTNPDNWKGNVDFLDIFDQAIQIPNQPPNIDSLNGGALAVVSDPPPVADFSSISTVNSVVLGQREEPFNLGGRAHAYTALAIEELHATHGEDTTGFFAFMAALNLGFSTTDFILLDTFRNMFPILGSIALNAIFALSISIVYFSPTFGWIANDRQGVVHDLSRHVYAAINLVLQAHAKDFPNHPIEAGGLRFIHYIVQWSIDEIIGQRNKTKLFARVFVGYYNLSPRNTAAENLAAYGTETTAGHYLHLWLDDQRGMWLANPAIAMTLHSTFYQMENAPARRMGGALRCYSSLAGLIANLPTPSLRKLDWSYAPYGAWDASAGGIRHALGDYITGSFVPRDFGHGDEIRQGRIAYFRGILPDSHLQFLHAMLLQTASLWLIDLDLDKVNKEYYMYLDLFEVPGEDEIGPDDM